MYKRDQKSIQKWATNGDKLVDVVAMVLCSIRQPWNAIGDQLADVRQNKAASKYLFGFKRNGYLYAVEHKARLYRKVLDCRRGRCEVIDLMRELMKVPGLGLVKAGFVVQLLCGEVGCMDSHNIKRFGLDASFFIIPKRVNVADQLQVIDGKIEAYIALCEANGGCQYLWDSWCDVLAAKQPNKFTDGDHVSRLHVEFLIN